MKARLAIAAAVMSFPLIAVGQDHAPSQSSPHGIQGERHHPDKKKEPLTTGRVNSRLEFENESVYVFRIRMAPHEKVPMHDVTPRVIVWLTDVHLRDIFPDGKSKDEVWKPGDTTWVPAQKHAGENLRDQPVEFIAIVPKAKSSCSSAGEPSVSH
jgi:quercetin dioxygenase-like cupin family protein